ERLQPRDFHATNSRDRTPGCGPCSADRGSNFVEPASKIHKLDINDQRSDNSREFFETRVPMTDILILNGPNLNRLGRREPGHYGTDTLADSDRRLTEAAREAGVTIESRQSNH